MGQAPVFASPIMTSRLLPGDQSHYNGEKNRLMVKWGDPTSALRLIACALVGAARFRLECLGYESQ